MHHPSFTRTLLTSAGAMALHEAQPAGARAPAVVVIQHAPGVDVFIQAMCARLSEAGYLAVAPDLYHRRGVEHRPGLERMRDLRDSEVIDDVNATISYLQSHPKTDAARLGVVGFCMGGRVAYLMASANPALKACVAYYPGSTRVAWGAGAPPFERTRDIACPVLAHFGADDSNPSPDDMRALDAELTRHRKTHEFHSYEGAGHAFMNFDNAERYREGAARASWPRTLDFLARYLKA